MYFNQVRRDKLFSSVLWVVLFCCDNQCYPPSICVDQFSSKCYIGNGGGVGGEEGGREEREADGGREALNPPFVLIT